MAAEAPKIARDGTMEVTAKEGIAFLEKVEPELADKIKQMKEEEAKKPTNGSGDAPSAENGTPKIPRDNTMVQTAEEGKIFLEKEGGVNEDAKTRAQEKELNDSKAEAVEEEDKEKEATKRCAEEETEEVDDAKKQKVEEENGEEKEEETKEEVAKE